MVSLNPKNWGKQKQPSDFQKQVLATVAGEHARSQGSLSDEAQKNQDRIKFDMVHDENVIDPLYQMWIITKDPYWLGQVVRCSHTTPTRYIEPYTADTYKLEEEIDDLERECVLPKRSWDSGTQYLIRGLTKFKCMSIDDSKRGRKAIIMQSTTNKLSVGFSPTRKEEEGY